MGQLVVGECTDVGAGVGGAVVGAGERRDLVEGEAGALGDVDDREPVDDLGVVTALAADAVRLWKDSGALVEADARGVQAGALGDLPDGQRGFVGINHRKRP